MTSHVVDASVVIKWFTDEVHAEAARRFKKINTSYSPQTCSGRSVGIFCGKKCGVGSLPSTRHASSGAV